MPLPQSPFDIATLLAQILRRRYAYSGDKAAQTTAVPNARQRHVTSKRHEFAAAIPCSFSIQIQIFAPAHNKRIARAECRRTHGPIRKGQPIPAPEGGKSQAV